MSRRLTGSFALLLITAFSFFASSAQAQNACTDFLSLGRSSNIDPSYQETISSWKSAWQRNAWLRLTGARSPHTEGDIQIENFLKAREFRSWFETHNRMKERLATDSEKVSAQIKLLPDPQAALQAKLLAMREAKHTIDVAYYIFRNDHSGLAFLNEIRAALKRGVTVRFLVDSTGTFGMSPHSELRALIDFAAREGGQILDLNGDATGKRASVEIVLFNPISSTITNAVRNLARWVMNQGAPIFGYEKVDPLAHSLNRRTHDKILLIDGAFEERAIAFMGGRNIGDEYYGMPEINGHTYVDFEVMMKGVANKPGEERSTLGAQVTEYFDTVYYHLGNKVLTRSILGLVSGYKKQLTNLEEAGLQTESYLKLDKDAEAIRDELFESGWSDQKVEIATTFHNLFKEKASNRFEKRDHRSELRNARALVAKVEQLIAKEQQEITIVSPYLWLSEKQVRLLKSWLLKDPKRKLTIYTNSLLTTDNMLAQILVDNVLGPSMMLDQGLSKPDGRIVRRSVSDQVKIYQHGRKDSRELGGEAEYGLLHAKGIWLKSLETVVIGTYNNDPRSLLLNTEGAAIIQGRELSQRFAVEIERIHSHSHLWGSDEYHQIRASEQLPSNKKLFAEHSQRFYRWVMRLNLWWIL